MAWEIPKTDWHGGVDADGNYAGDYFNAVDFNRIKNNLIYLRETAVKMYAEFTIQDMGADKTVGDYFFADEINKMEQNLAAINEMTLKRPFGGAQVYADNGNTMDFTQLNRLESATADLYDRLTNQAAGRRLFTWTFGTKEDF